jgi:hypothetical protein
MADVGDKMIAPENKALNRDAKGAPAEDYTEFGLLSNKNLGGLVLDKNKNTIEIDKRDLSIGQARYRDATHITKNLAVKPNYTGSGDLMNHTNIEIHLYDDKGRERPMTARYIRDWGFYPQDPKKTIATLGPDDPLTLVPGDSKRFRYDGASTTDAPAQQNIYKDKRSYVYLQEFVAGNPKTGGFYYQAIMQLDPDATSRIRVKNAVPLSPREYQEAVKIIKSPGFGKEYADKFLFPNLPDTTQADTGVDSTVPDFVRQKQKRKEK